MFNSISSRLGFAFSFSTGYILGTPRQLFSNDIHRDRVEYSVSVVLNLRRLWRKRSLLFYWKSQFTL